MALTKKKSQCRKIRPQAEGPSFLVDTCYLVFLWHQLIPVCEQMFLRKSKTWVWKGCGIPFVGSWPWFSATSCKAAQGSPWSIPPSTLKFQSSHLYSPLPKPTSKLQGCWQNVVLAILITQLLRKPGCLDMNEWMRESEPACAAAVFQVPY